MVASQNTPNKPTLLYGFSAAIRAAGRRCLKIVGNFFQSMSVNFERLIFRAQYLEILRGTVVIQNSLRG
jgi:hypothetical protein